MMINSFTTLLLELSQSLPPGLIIIVGGLIAPIFPFAMRQTILLLLIALSTWGAWNLSDGTHHTLQMLGIEFILTQADALTRPFGLVFHIAAAINVIYAIHARSRTTDASGLIYAGAAIAALYAGDFLTLFFYWEITAFASVILILHQGTRRAQGAAMRYLMMQLASGMCLLTGALILWRHGNGLLINPLDPMSLAGGAIFIAFGIKAAFPFLNGWLQDAYPEASVSGTVILSAFTTKLAIYMLARCFLGFEPLIWIGALMTLFPVFFAVIENDLRRVLAFSLNNQLGFMVVGIGVGTELALNGTVAHAFAHIIYKSLLFMSMGAVLLRTNTIKATELGGLWRQMPLTMLFCIIGAVSISAFPLFSGFVTKSLTIGGVAQTGNIIIWLILIFASAGVLEHAGIKIPYFAFFARDRGLKTREAPISMLLAMGLAASLCLIIGIAPQWLYAILPYPVNYDIWNTGHILGETQLLIFAALAFGFLVWRRLYPPERNSTILNSDWFLRRGIPNLIAWSIAPVIKRQRTISAKIKAQTPKLMHRIERTSHNSRFTYGTVNTGTATAILIALFALLLALSEIF